MTDLPVSAQDLADLRTELREFIGRADTVLTAVATKEDVATESEQRRRTVRRVVAAGVVALVIVVGVIVAFRLYNLKHNRDTARVCVTFANKHNGLVDGVEDMLRVAVAPNLNDPRASQFLTQELANFETRRVNVDDCTP